MRIGRLPTIILAAAIVISATIAYRTFRPSDSRAFTPEDHQTLPASFRSANEARAWVRGNFTGGRVDQLSLPGRDALVVFQHGSGIPVIRIGVYRRGFLGWKLVAQPGVPAALRSEFLRASADGSVISVTGERSRARGVLLELE